MATLLTPEYAPSSPYFKTPIHGRYLGYYVHRRVAPHPLDRPLKIVDQRYVNRPDLLAHDLYGDDNYFWVVPVRNGFQDPIFDLQKDMWVMVPDPSIVRKL